MTRGNFIMKDGKPTFMKCADGDWIKKNETFIRIPEELKTKTK